MPYGRKGSGLKNCIPLHSIHFYKTTDPVRHNFLRLDPFLIRSSACIPENRRRLGDVPFGNGTCGLFLDQEDRIYQA